MTIDSSSVLDNAAWHSLIGPHTEVAVGHGGARRYQSDVSVFGATDGNSAESWAALAEIAPPDGAVVIFRGDPIEAPADWKQAYDGNGFQLVAPSVLSGVPQLPTVDEATGRQVSLRELAVDDVDEMIALVALTEPGPFERRTIELGGYVGIFHDDELVAMAGRRMHPPGYCEISAVCTHPDARRRGYGSIVTAHVASQIAADGETPFLHVAGHNLSAKAVYEQLGFTVRRTVRFAVLRVPR